MSEPRLARSTGVQTTLLAVFMIVALASGIFVLSTFDIPDFLVIDNPLMFLLGVAAQIAVSAVYVLAWQVNLRQCGMPQVDYHDAVLHCGIVFLGKYIPGKIGGLIMRGMAIHRHTPSAAMIIKATTIEQAAMVHAGLLVCGGVLALGASLWLCIGVLALGLLSMMVVMFPEPFVSRMRPHTGRFPRIAAALEVFAEDFRQTYFTIFGFMLLIWLLSALALTCMLQSFAVNLPFSEALWITTLSFLTGFFAVILPAGIGAREGAMIVLLAPWCSTVTALTVATLHRVTTVTIDLVAGSYAVHRISK